MKLLLDENLPVKLKQFFSRDHQVFTVREMLWSGVKNGQLLELMANHDFDALVTIDKNLKHQQNLDKSDIKLIILNSPDNKLATLKPYVQALEDRISKSIDRVILEITL